MNGKKRKTAVIAMAAVLCVMMIASPLAVMAQETAPAVTRDGNVQKETAPAIRLPENLRAKAGTALKAVALPEPWTWADDSTVISAETAEYPARLCVDDTAYDYSEVEGYNGGSYVERMVAVTAEAAKAEVADPVKGKPRRLPGDTPVTYDIGDIEINGNNFPDVEFQKWLRQQSYGTDGTITQAEIADITEINVYGKTEIQSLTGIEHFTALKTLSCASTGIGSLNVSSNKNLTTLNCPKNASLTNLTVEGATALKTLYCNSTRIGSLDVSSNKNLIDLDCSINASLTNLTVEGATALKSLRCNNTGIGSLDVSSNKNLTDLNCYDNASLTNLTVEGATALKTLHCSNTGIGSLDVSSNKNLTDLNCYDNASLKSLTVEDAAALKNLYCQNTGIGSLDVSHNKDLTDLYCYDNASLTNLTVEGAEALEILNCNSTGIGSLDVSSNTELTFLSCKNNRLAYLNIGTNNKLTNVYSTDLKAVDVTVTSDRFQMADKFAGIDADAVDDKSVRGAVYDKTSGTMSNYSEEHPIKYTYYCGTSGNGVETIEVTLNITLGSTIDIKENLDKTYDGKAVSAAPAVIKEGSDGTVSFTWERKSNANAWETINSAPTDAGTYRVTATLESDNTYKGETSEPVQFTILRAANGWTGPLSITGWTYGKSPNDPTAATKFGKASYLYSNREHGSYTDTVPSHAGRWYVKAVVAGTDNYESLESDAVPFIIAPKDITTDSQITVPDITADTDLDELVIQDGDQTLVQGTDYDVTKTRDGANVTVAITGKGNYTGTITRTYTVEEKAPSGGVKDSDNSHDGTKTAQTGDPTNVGLLAAMILLSAGCMFFLIRKKGQKK